MLDAGLARAVRLAAQRQGVSAASLFHLAWSLVLGRTTGRDDVLPWLVLVVLPLGWVLRALWRRRRARKA